MAVAGDHQPLDRFAALVRACSDDISTGRLVEAHADADAILAEICDGGTAPGEFWGVWAAQTRGTGVDARRGAHGWELNGTKEWCSGASSCTHALVTARTDTGNRLFGVDLGHPGVSADSSGWANAGMRDSDTGTVTFDAVPADAIGLMLFTSGTTSAPKVVQLSHANLAAQLATFFKVYDYDADSRILNPLPMHFTDGILHGPLIAFMTGAMLYRPQRFNVQELGTLLDSVYRDRITHFNLVPAMLSLMDRLGEAYRDALATPDFRYIRSSGDRLPEALWRSVQERFGVKIINTYGLSETVCEALYCGPSDDTFRIGTIGNQSAIAPAR